MSRTLLAIVVGFSLGFQVAALSECYGGEPELKAAEPAAVVDPIEAALVQPTEVQYLDTPLPDVVADLKLRHRISIGIDKEALAAGGIAPDSPISHDARDLPLEAVLNRMLANHRLDWTIQEGELFITTPDGARNMPTTRVYSLGRLTTAPGFDYGKLIEIVQGMIAPDSWMANGGANVVRAAPPLQSIVVRADFRAQRRVADLIDVLQRAADNPDERTTAGGLTAGGRDAMDQVLATTIDLHYLDTPIRDVAIHLGIIHKIPFHVNATEIVTNGKGDDLAITADFKGTTLASALTRILSPLLLDWTVTDGVVLITTRTVAESTDFQQVRAYPVGDLVGADGDWNEDANDLIETLT